MCIWFISYKEETNNNIHGEPHVITTSVGLVEVCCCGDVAVRSSTIGGPEDGEQLLTSSSAAR